MVEVIMFLVTFIADYYVAHGNFNSISCMVIGT